MTDKEILVEKVNSILKDHFEFVPLQKTFDVVDDLLKHHIKPFPCEEGDTIYHIVKCCGTNTGFSEFYKPNKEFDKQCKFLDPQSWYDDSDRCEAAEDSDDGDYCSLYLKIFCDECKERLTYKKDKFTLSKRNYIYNTPMFDSTTDVEDTYYLTEEDVIEAIERIKNGSNK